MENRIGGIHIAGLGEVSKAGEIIDSPSNLASRKRSTIIIDPVKNSGNIARTSPEAQKQKVRASGASIKATLYYGFFGIISIALIAALINKTGFDLIDQNLVLLYENSETITPENKSRLIEIHNEIAKSSQTSLILALSVLALGIFTANFIGKRLSNIILELSSMMNELASGNNNITITPPSSLGFELAKMYEALIVFQNNAKEVERLRLDENIRQKQKEEELIAMKEIGQNLNDQIGKIFQTINSNQSEMALTAKDMEDVSTKLKNSIDIISTNLSSATVNSTDVSASANELLKQTQQILQNANNSNQLTSLAVKKSLESNDRVQSLKKLADNIGDIVGLIQKITEQTHLLSLNAAIEASRAGEAGKGFAIVANEVKSLANQTVTATDKITDNIEAIRNEVNKTVDNIVEVSKVIEDLAQASGVITTSVSVQNNATEKISLLISDVSNSIKDVNSNTQALVEDANRTKEASNRILKSSEQASIFVNDVTGELNSILNKLLKKE